MPNIQLFREWLSNKIILKLTRQYRKALWVVVVHCFIVKLTSFSAMEGGTMNIGYFPDYLSALSRKLLRFFWTTFVETAVCPIRNYSWGKLNTFFTDGNSPPKFSDFFVKLGQQHRSLIYRLNGLTDSRPYFPLIRNQTKVEKKTESVLKN